jgi:hypothetical protein
VVKLSGATGGVLWAVSGGSAGADTAAGLAVDYAGTAYFGGSYLAAATLGNASLG